tara:strand:- start:172 stop:402 length:231 start_codon:yes stop_codon:yes gene_type:complete
MELDKNYIKVLENEMNILGEKILDKDEKTGNRRGNLHTALWVLKDRVDEIEGRNEKTSTRNETSSGPISSDTKVSS